MGLKQSSTFFGPIRTCFDSGYAVLDSLRCTAIAKQTGEILRYGQHLQAMPVQHRPGAMRGVPAKRRAASFGPEWDSYPAVVALEPSHLTRFYEGSSPLKCSP